MLEQAAEWEEARVDRAEAVVGGGKAKVASGRGLAETAFAPTAVKKRHTNWERPVMISSVPSVGHP